MRDEVYNAEKAVRSKRLGALFRGLALSKPAGGAEEATKSSG
jgi:hypothetical protein